MKSVTGPELVRSIHDTRDDDALAAGRLEFAERYRPVLFAFARRVGVESADGDETVERVMAEILSEAADASTDGRTDSARDWLFAKAGARIASASLAALPALESEAELENIWRAEWRRAVIRRGLDELYQAHSDDSVALKAFELHALEHKRVNDVANDLSMSRSAVFGAKNRLMDQLREIVSRLEDEF